MLGWHISVYRQLQPSRSPGEAESPLGARIAVWQAGSEGLGWLNKLGKSGSVIRLGGSGYPLRYTARASVILPVILGGPPKAHDVWRTDPEDAVGERWLGRSRIERRMADGCAADEWLIVEAWDES